MHEHHYGHGQKQRITRRAQCESETYMCAFIWAQTGLTRYCTSLILSNWLHSHQLRKPVNSHTDYLEVESWQLVVRLNHFTTYRCSFFSLRGVGRKPLIYPPCWSHFPLVWRVWSHRPFQEWDTQEWTVNSSAKFCLAKSMVTLRGENYIWIGFSTFEIAFSKSNYTTHMEAQILFCLGNVFLSWE